MTRLILFLLLPLLALAAVWPAAARADRITVFAAASLTEALAEVAEAFTDETGHQVILSFAGSSALARQIELGAPADIFVSASPDWMDHLAERGLIAPDTRADIAGNRLVLIAPAGQGDPVEIGPALDLPARLAGGRLAMALVEAVPAGIYGRAALENLGLWAGVAPHVAQADNVRAALAFVATGEAPLGIVYASDAVAEPRVTVLATFPEASHPPIRYPAAAVSGRDTAPVRAFLDHLCGAEASAILARHGFVTGQWPE